MLIKLPIKFIGAAPVSFQVPPELIVTSPVNVLAPVLASVNVPPTVVDPPTERVHVFVAPVTNAVPDPTTRFPVMDKAAPVVKIAVPARLTFPPMLVITDVAVAEPLILKSFVMVVTPVNVFALVPDSVKL